MKLHLILRQISRFRLSRLLHLFRLLICITLVLSCSACSSKVPQLSPDKLPGFVSELGISPTQDMIFVDSKTQTLTMLKDNQILKKFTISTGKKGLGERANTYKTPQGLHRINEKIGKGVPKYGIFHRRHYTGNTWKKIPPAKHRKDFISTRILRLEGLQPGLNKGKDWLGRTVDTEKRAVYIHGTTMEWKLGMPSTKGCIHMSAEDVIALFNSVPVGTLVWIN